MQEENITSVLAVEEIEENGIYFNKDYELIKVLEVNQQTKELRLYNIAERYTTYYVKMDKHNLVKRIR